MSVRRGELIFAWVGGTVTGVDAGVVVSPEQVSLGVLVSAVPRDAVDDAVAVCGVGAKRSDGKLLPHVVAYLAMALCLFAEDEYAEVATKVTGSLDRWGCWNASWRVPTASAITQARKRLGRKVFWRFSSGRAARWPVPARRGLGCWGWAGRGGRGCGGGGCWRSTADIPPRIGMKRCLVC